MADIHVVDDEAMIGMLISYVLKKLGHQVYVYRSGAELFEQFGDRPIDCVMTDLVTPRQDGFELCQRLRLHPRTAEVPIVMMTGFEIEPELFALLGDAYGIVDILPKPFTVERLLAITQRALRAERRRWPMPEAGSPGALAREELAQKVRSIGERLQPRINARLPVQFSLGEALVDAYTLNVSVGGMFISTEADVQPFSRILVRVLASGQKGGLLLDGTVVHVQPAQAGVAGFGVALDEKNIHRFYAWYELVARLNMSSGRRVTDEILVLGMEPHLVSPLQRLIGLFCMTELSLTPVASWDEALSASNDSARSIKLLLVNAGKDEVLVDLPKIRAYSQQQRGKIALLGLQEGERHRFPAELDLACLHAQSMRELIDAIGRWLALPIRTTVRVPLIGVALLSRDGVPLPECNIGDVSVGGMRLISTTQLPGETPLFISFALPGVDKPIETHAEVRWMRRERADRFSYGVSFTDLEPQARETIEHYVIMQWSKLIQNG